MALNLRQRVAEFLQPRTDVTFTARDIALWIFEQFPDECSEKRERSAGTYIQTDSDLIQQLVAEIGSQRPRMQKMHPQIKTIEGRPRRYYWTELDSSEEVAIAEGQSLVDEQPERAAAASALEHDLYPLLAEYLRGDELGVFAMRIDEKRSSNKHGSGANEWLHPDLVGLEDLTSDWSRELRDCVGTLGEVRARLWSFEVKLLLNRSNARKAFFQVVSNSSWAHLGYLVAERVEGDGTLKELRMLSAAHGIGLIQLDCTNPSESQILIPARERDLIDWEMCNRLVQENADFKDFISRVRRFHQTGEVIGSEWLLS
ncbi:MAG: COG2958 family protein [Cellvibrio sp.]